MGHGVKRKQFPLPRLTTGRREFDQTSEVNEGCLLDENPGKTAGTEYPEYRLQALMGCFAGGRHAPLVSFFVQASKARRHKLKVEVKGQLAPSDRIQHRALPVPGGGKIAESIESDSAERDKSQVYGAVLAAFYPRLFGKYRRIGFLEIIDHFTCPWVECENPVLGTASERRRRSETADGRVRRIKQFRVEIDDDIARGHQQFPIAPGIFKIQSKDQIQHNRCSRRA